MNVIMDVLMLPMSWFVYPKAVTIAFVINTVITFGGVGLCIMAARSLGSLDKDSKWSERIMHIGFVMVNVGAVLFMILVPIMLVTGTKA